MEAEPLRKVLVLDDDSSQMPKIEGILRSLDTKVEVDWETDLGAAKARLSRDRVFGTSHYDLIIADMYLDEDCEDLGIDLLLEANKQYPRERLFLMSGQSRDRVLKEKGDSEFFPFLDKCDSIREMRERLVSRVVAEEPTPSQSRDSGLDLQAFFWGLPFLLALLALWAYELLGPSYYSSNLTKAKDAPLVQALGSAGLQAEFQDLLDGGLSTELNNPYLVNPEHSRLAINRIFGGEDENP